MEEHISPRTRIRYSFNTLLTGSDLSRRRLPYMTAHSDEPGPALWLTACAHGDEVGGMVVVQEIFKRLRRRPMLCGSLHAFPLMNPTGFDIGTRAIALSEEDLNRSFPGDAEGSLAQRIAHQIMQAIVKTQPAAVIDLHNDWVNSIPYTVLEPRGLAPNESVRKQVRAIVNALGQLSIRDTDHLNTSLTYGLVREGIPAVTLELGESHVVNEPNVALGVAGVWNVMSQLGLVEPNDEQANSTVPAELRERALSYSSRPLAGTSGVIRFLRRPGDVVHKGDVLAKIFNAFGKLQETIKSPHEHAIILGHTDSSVAYPGATIMAFGVVDSATTAST